MKSLFHKLLILVCALYLSGAHWTALQVTAWTGMLVVRTQQGDLAEAVKTTFDGAHPCRMCTAIEDGQKEEGGDSPEAPAMKKAQEFKSAGLEWFAVPAPVSSGEVCWADFVKVDCWRTDAPLTPPPVA